MANLTRQSVIDQAIGEVGYLEKASNYLLYDKTANAGGENYTKYWADLYPSLNGSYWCACFVDWCFTLTYGKAKASALLDPLGKFYNDRGYIATGDMRAYFPYQSYVPQAGDVVLFYKANSSPQWHHTGLVVWSDGHNFNTVEGNTSSGPGVEANGGSVAWKQYSVDTSTGSISRNGGTEKVSFCHIDYASQGFTDFVDVSSDYPWASHIGKVANYGIMGGFTDGTFRPTSPIDRASMCVVIERALRVCGFTNFKSPTNVSPYFSDFSIHPLKSYIMHMYGIGVVNGSSGFTFRPNDALKRYEAAIMIRNAMSVLGYTKWYTGKNDFYNDIGGNCGKAHINTLQWNGVIGDVNVKSFFPYSNVDRGAIAKWTANMIGAFGK